MKKGLLILGATVISLSLCACGSDAITAFSEPESFVAEEEAKPTKEESKVVPTPEIDNTKDDEAENEVDEAAEIEDEAEEVKEEEVAETQEEEVVEEVEETKEAEPEEEEAKDADGISPEFKAAMDEYEAFYDEYCDFMTKYLKGDSTDIFGMLNDYNKMSQRLIEMDEKFDKIGSSDMTPAESKYYIEVSARIQKKLLEVAY